MILEGLVAFQGMLRWSRPRPKRCQGMLRQSRPRPKRGQPACKGVGKAASVGGESRVMPVWCACWLRYWWTEVG